MSYRVMKGIYFSVVITPLPLQPLDSSESILARATTFRAKVQEEHWEDQAREVVRSSFQRNLDDMVRDIRARGVGVILCTIPVNLKNYPPFNRDDESLIPEACPDELQTKNQSDIMLTPGGQKIDCKKLMSGPRELTGEDGLKAFQLGHCALAAENYKEAKKRLVQALENDSFPTRATPALNRIIRNTARSRQVILADVESSFDQAAADRIPGDDIFVDNVHPTLSGNYLIALTILESMARERVVDLPLEWRGRVDREVSIYLSRMPEDYLSQAYLFNAKANATKGLFCRALDMCGQALLFSPDNQQAALLKSNINELFKNGRSVVPDTYNQGR